MKRCPECGQKPTCRCDRERPFVTRAREEFDDSIREKESLAFIYYNERTGIVEVKTSDGRTHTMRSGDTCTIWRSAKIGLY